ncbi:unnamed protein product [Vitrella brassicaformis CCMP3155]|uniref:Uncharacterized protein n=1 Tax=Vitrella brassicaformis (strain CCMP3155) TaxID=1169540 RepID=A0A0G4EDP2_VITBC|nr:unnamed protein product [Vitrella brassicaformis CCMP3155]|eukprot:CEL93845.1 unnamed protein product [Vitrella brassicaformis CCMP3155]
MDSSYPPLSLPLSGSSGSPFDEVPLTDDGDGSDLEASAADVQPIPMGGAKVMAVRKVDLRYPGDLSQLKRVQDEQPEFNLFTWKLERQVLPSEAEGGPGEGVTVREFKCCTHEGCDVRLCLIASPNLIQLEITGEHEYSIHTASQGFRTALDRALQTDLSTNGTAFLLLLSRAEEARLRTAVKTLGFQLGAVASHVGNITPYAAFCQIFRLALKDSEVSKMWQAHGLPYPFPNQPPQVPLPEAFPQLMNLKGLVDGMGQLMGAMPDPMMAAAAFPAPPLPSFDQEECDSDGEGSKGGGVKGQRRSRRIADADRELPPPPLFQPLDSLPPPPVSKNGLSSPPPPPQSMDLLRLTQQMDGGLAEGLKAVSILQGHLGRGGADTSPSELAAAFHLPPMDPMGMAMGMGMDMAVGMGIAASLKAKKRRRKVANDDMPFLQRLPTPAPPLSSLLRSQSRPPPPPLPQPPQHDDDSAAPESPCKSSSKRRRAKRPRTRNRDSGGDSPVSPGYQPSGMGPLADMAAPPATPPASKGARPREIDRRKTIVPLLPPPPPTAASPHFPLTRGRTTPALPYPSPFASPPLIGLSVGHPPAEAIDFTDALLRRKSLPADQLPSLASSLRADGTRPSEAETAHILASMGRGVMLPMPPHLQLLARAETLLDERRIKGLIERVKAGVDQGADVSTNAVFGRMRDPQLWKAVKHVAEKSAMSPLCEEHFDTNLSAFIRDIIATIASSTSASASATSTAAVQPPGPLGVPHPPPLPIPRMPAILAASKKR